MISTQLLTRHDQPHPSSLKCAQLRRNPGAGRDPISRPGAACDKGLLVTALRAAGFVVFAINPRAVARYRDRYGQAGGKSDPGDAVVLANILRTDRHAHRHLPADTVLACAVKAAARQHQEAIWARQQTMSRLRSLLHDYYPQAL